MNRSMMPIKDNGDWQGPGKIWRYKTTGEILIEEIRKSKELLQAKKQKDETSE